MTDKQRQTEFSGVDAMLAQRAQASSDLPWLELRVRSHVEWREQARQWLRSHPEGLSTPPRPLRLRIWSAICGLAGARVWHIGGIVLIALVLGYVATLLLPAATFIPSEGRPVSQWTLASMGAGLATITIALANWPRLRQFYG
ncbi:MAG: hypothetical protein M3R04_06850 [bacterium]|nr:hypothetical protein [bacterium]